MKAPLFTALALIAGISAPVASYARPALHKPELHYETATVSGSYLYIWIRNSGNAAAAEFVVSVYNEGCGTETDRFVPGIAAGGAYVIAVPLWSCSWVSGVVFFEVAVDVYSEVNEWNEWNNVSFDWWGGTSF